jgi:hypothetical protein
MNPNQLPAPRPMHARTESGYVTQSANFKATAPRTIGRAPRTTDVVDSDGITTSRPDSPKAIRAPRGSMPTPKRTAPVVTRMASAEDRARLSGPRIAARIAGVRPNPFQN